MRKWIIAIVSVFMLAACQEGYFTEQATLGDMTITRAEVVAQGDGTAHVYMVVDNDGSERYLLSKVEAADGTELPLYQGERNNRETSQGDVLGGIGDNDPNNPDTIAADLITPELVSAVEVPPTGVRLSEGTYYALIEDFDGEPGGTLTLTVFFSRDGSVTIEAPITERVN